MRLTTTDSPPAAGGSPEAPDRALALLLQAFDCAAEVQCDVWDFAVELEQLRSAGLTNSVLRWLVAKGYVCHAVETTRGRADRRSFRPVGRFTVADRICVVLTVAGAATVRRPNDDVAAALAPHWDAGPRVLSLGKLVVKQFRQPAPDQEIVLAAFEEEGWPELIDDPLPPRSGYEPKRRLLDTIKNLNRYHQHQLIHFGGNGTGRGVLWRRINGSYPTATPELP